MSCDAVAFSALLWLASAGGAPLQATPAVAVAPPVVSAEPLYADIVRRAGALKGEVDAYGQATTLDVLPGYEAFKVRIAELAALDMKGHEDLKARGVDGDLKCILRGIAQDLPLRLEEVDKAETPKARETALREMGYLLRDNVEVITAPPKPPV